MLCFRMDKRPKVNICKESVCPDSSNAVLNLFKAFKKSCFWCERKKFKKKEKKISVISIKGCIFCINFLTKTSLQIYQFFGECLSKMCPFKILRFHRKIIITVNIFSVKIFPFRNPYYDSFTWDLRYHCDYLWKPFVKNEL